MPLHAKAGCARFPQMPRGKGSHFWQRFAWQCQTPNHHRSHIEHRAAKFRVADRCRCREGRRYYMVRKMATTTRLPECRLASASPGLAFVGAVDRSSGRQPIHRARPSNRARADRSHQRQQPQFTSAAGGKVDSAAARKINRPMVDEIIIGNILSPRQMQRARHSPARTGVAQRRRGAWVAGRPATP